MTWLELPAAACAEAPAATLAAAPAGRLSPPWQLLMGVLDQIDYGIALGRPEGGWELNRTGRLQLAEAGFPLRLQAGQLLAHDEAQSRALHAAMRAAQTQLHRRLLTLRAPGRQVSVAVVPAGMGEDGGTGPVLLMIGRRSLCPRLTAQQYSAAHGLTPSEAAVLVEVLAGAAPRSIAQHHGVALSTVRTQVASIKAKTGHRRLQDLMVQAAKLPPLVPLFEAVR